MALCLSLSSCGGVQHRKQSAEDFIRTQNYKAQSVHAGAFRLFTAHPTGRPHPFHSGLLNVVIEGDGFSWKNQYTPSNDPTPKDPIGLKIAASLSPQGVYLARPCQFTWSEPCAVPYWTDRRFDRVVIAAYHAALDSLKGQYGNAGFHLSGYSGGGYIALVLAAEREDIKRVTTIAGVLDPLSWTEFHDVTPLKTAYGSEALLEQSSQAEFLHLCGGDDEVVPCVLAQNTAHQAVALGLTNHRLVTLPDEDHESIWEKAASYMH